MKDNWTKTELFEALDAARHNVTNSDQYLAITYARKLAARTLSSLGMHEIIGEQFVGGLRVDPPLVENDPKF